ncbi:MAG: HAMP domain-containing sensor histidine kinase [Acidobacteriota bacterium]
MNDPKVRRAQVVFLIILAFSAAQVLWWLVDQSLFARAVHDRWQGLYEADVVAAVAMLDRGARTESIQSLFPHLDVSLDGVAVSQDAIAALSQERRSHVRRYAWEAAFFLLVIFGGMGIILRTVRRDARLRRWQSNFLAAVSHELKSPIASLQLAAETLELRDADPAHRRRLLRRILADVDRLGATVGKVIDTERLDQGRMQLDRGRIRLDRAVTAAVAEQELPAKERGVEIGIDVPRLVIEADGVGIQTVLRNLLDNALKAVEPGGQILVSARGEADEIRLTVTDDGHGFPPDEAAHLFDKFYRVGDELRRTRPGSGLGLYLSRRFVELEGGDIFARSAGPGAGSEFTVVWPAAEEEAPAPATAPWAPAVRA